MSLHVYILTWCPQPSSLFGNTLVFQTLRTGFPNAEVHVTDNASLPEVRETVRNAATAVGGAFEQYEREVARHSYIEHVLNRQQSGAAILLEPDVCFWDEIETWSFDAILAGRLLPRYQCEFSGCVTQPRLHPSLLWIPDVRRFRAAVEQLRSRYYEFHPFRPVMLPWNGVWQRFDVGAALLAAMPQSVHAFQERELNTYDHLFCGTDLSFASGRQPAAQSRMFEQIHRTVQSDYRAMKGAWRLQEDYFQALGV